MGRPPSLTPLALSPSHAVPSPFSLDLPSLDAQGEITTKAKVDYEAIVRKTAREIGFTSEDVGLNADTCKVREERERGERGSAVGICSPPPLPLLPLYLRSPFLTNPPPLLPSPNLQVLVYLEEQSPDIGQGVHGLGTKAAEEIGAGDQGHMFGYATDETPELMPLTHVLATQLGHRLTTVRKDGTVPWLRPDGKTQVSIEYKKDGGAMVPVRVHTILISTQHAPDVTNEQIAKDLHEHVIKPVVPAKYLDDKTIFHLNPSGRFVIGGPHGDAGLTGRKIIIDTYGGWGAHGGGAFSGKDPTKVDRSGAYIARQAAKSIVASGLARRALVQVSYAIGVAQPLSVHVDTYGTGTIPDKEILAKVLKNFDFRPGMIARALDLFKPRYLQTAAYGHFGREPVEVFTWEKTKDLNA